MSTFKGIMREYGLLSLDRFDGQNLQSTAYFLSHCHKDHMQGITSPGFLYRLQSNSAIKLYCSRTTKDLLLIEDEVFKGIQKSIVPLDIDTPTIISIPERHSVKIYQKVTVTLLHAGHCPGSVMFLFEGEEGCALYSGDFRIQEGDIKRFTHLHSGDRVKVIDSLYIDTTFFVPQFYYIPSREDILDTVFSEVQEWIGQSPYHIILIRYRAGLGYEHLFVQLSRRFSMKIHFSDAKFAQYQAVKELKEEDFATKDPNSTQIHACGWKRNSVGFKSSLPCSYKPPKNKDFHVRVITISTMYFAEKENKDAVVKRHERLRVCYSFHSSYSEIRDVIMYLKPKRISPNVIPIYSTKEKIQERLDFYLNAAKDICSPPPRLSQTPKKLGAIKKRKHLGKKSKENSSELFDGLIFSDGDSAECPVVKKSKFSEGATKEQSHEFTQNEENDKDTNSPVFHLSYSTETDSGDKNNQDIKFEASPKSNPVFHVSYSDNEEVASSPKFASPMKEMSSPLFYSSEDEEQEEPGVKKFEDSDEDSLLSEEDKLNLSDPGISEENIDLSSFKNDFPNSLSNSQKSFDSDATEDYSSSQKEAFLAGTMEFKKIDTVDLTCEDSSLEKQDCDMNEQIDCDIKCHTPPDIIVID